jgi:hypothetical protein
MIDARSQNGTITLPLSTDIPYRILTLKDIYGAATVSSITLTTQGADVFEDGTTSRLLNGAFETTTLYAGQAGFWYVTGGSRLATAAIGTLSTGLIQNPLRLGTLSTQTAIQFPGLRSNYTGTVIAGQGTGVGTQELLLYQASSISDQIRLQTTGNIVFEAGAAARSWPSTAALVTPTLYIAGSTSNVGIGTASPATTLDVAGAGRFQTLSTTAMNVSSINGIVPGAAFIGSTNFISATTVQALTISTQSINVSSVNGILPGAAFNGSTLALSTAIITTSTLTTNTLQVNNYINAQGGTLSNLGAEYFTTSRFTTTFTPLSLGSLQMWLDGADSSAASMLLSGQNILTWKDKSGNGFNASASNTVPLTPAAINGVQAVNFNGTGYLVAPSMSSGNYTGTALTFIIVGMLSNANVGPSVGVLCTQGTGGDWNSSGNFACTTAQQGSSCNYITTTRNGANTPAFGTFPYVGTSPFIILVRYDGTNGTARFNGLQQGILTSYTSAFNFSNYWIGNRGGGGGPTFQGYFGEVITYSNAVPLSNIERLEGYLAFKWGITLADNSHPYYSTPPLPYGTAYTIGATLSIDSSSNFSVRPTNTTSLIGNAQITSTLVVSTVSTFLVNAQTVSTPNLIISTINGQTFGAPIQSSIIGLGTAGYISSTQLTSTVTGLAFTGSTLGLSAGTIGVSTINIISLSSVQGYISSFRTDSLTVGGPTGYVTIQDLTTGTVSTGQLVAGAGFISSLQINTLSFGPSGYVIVGDVIANSLSTTRLNTQALYANNLYVGNTSTQSAILFPGVDGNFRGTAVAEQVTGIGTEELLLYKVSTTSDQIRLQTTGNIVFEAGASARSWPSTAALATPTLYIAGSTSNVGVGTAAPATTLDVAGTGRFQVVSSYALNVSSINGIIPGAAFNGSTMALSTGSITTNSLQAYSYVNMTGGVFSNVATEYFTTPKYTTTFTPASIAGLKVWLDASKTTSITSNGSGQVLSLSNLTGLGNATQGTPSSAPLTGQYTFNNLNVLSNSFNTQLVLPSINYTSQYRTAFLVLQAPYYSAWIGANRSTDSIGMWSYGDLEIETAASWIALTSFPSNAQNIPIIIDIHSSAASNGVYMNGSNLGSLLRTFATGSFTDTIGLGGTGTPLGGYYGGSWYFGEFIYYDAELTVSQRQTVEGYLAWKWGTQGLLAPTHPSYSSPPPPLGIVYLPAGSVGTDATSNLTIQATINTKISLAANTQITGLLTTSTIGVSNITATYANISSLSTQALIVSSINNSTTTQLVGAPIQSTVIGLGTAGYISTQQLAATSNYFKNLLFLDVSTSVSTATLYTSNTSNWSRNLLQDFSTPVSSVATAVGATSNYFQNLLALNVSSAISTATLFTSNTSNFILSTNQSSISTAFVTAIQGYISSLVVDSLAIGSNSGFINIGDVIATSLSTLQLNTGLLTASGTVSAPELIVSSINGLPLLTLANLTSTVSGTNSNISSMIDPTELTSTVTGLGTANFISSVGLTTILNSTVTGVNTTIAAMIDPVELASSITGLGTTGFISSIGLDARFASTTANLGTAGYLSSSQLLSTVQGLGSAGYASTSYVVGQISSFSTAMGQVTSGTAFVGSTIFLSAATIQASNISSFQITAQNITTQALSTNALIFGTGTGTLLMPDIAPNTIYTSTVTTSNLQIGWTSNQSPLQFYGFGTYSNTVIVEQSTGTTTQELFVFRGSNAADRIRFQTTGYMAIETGVSSRLYTAALSNAIPAVMIDINSNVGIRLAAPAVPLDVGGTARAITLSSLTLQTSTIEGAIFTRDLYANARTFLQGEVSTSFLLGNYNTLSFRTAGTQRATFTQAGNLGIGVAAPQFPVDIAGITRVSTIYNSTSISYNFISAPLLVASTVNTENAQITNISTNQINASLIYGRWNDAQYYVLQTL